MPTRCGSTSPIRRTPATTRRAAGAASRRVCSNGRPWSSRMALTQPHAWSRLPVPCPSTGSQASPNTARHDNVQKPKDPPMRLTDFDVLTFDMIGTLIDFEQGVLDFARPRLLRAKPELSDTEILEAYAKSQSVVRTK